MLITPLAIPDILLITPKVFGDARGFFYESFNQKAFNAAINAKVTFVQDNHSRSARHVLRGLHYQLSPMAQGKLVRVIAGEIFDVAVDIRRDSSSFGRWVGSHLSAENKQQLWVPPGFAHGFVTLSENAEVLYKTTEYYAPVHDRSIRWNDPAIGIEWPFEGEPVLAEKDRNAPLLADAE